MNSPDQINEMAGIKYWTIPGLAGSNAAHWQTIWEQLRPGDFNRVEQDNWDWPVMTEWTKRLDDRLLQASSPVILVAHSMGCLTAVHWSRHYVSEKVVGALLVAPADAEQSERLSFVEGFAPIPIQKLPFPTVVVASTNDRYMTAGRAAYFAEKWGSEFIDVGEQGHINASSGLGDWSFGQRVLKDLTNKVKPTK